MKIETEMKITFDNGETVVMTASQFDEIMLFLCSGCNGEEEPKGEEE